MIEPPVREETLEEAVHLLEADLGIREGFLESLNDADDWSFVIKSHAFIEAALAHLIADALTEPALQEVFANLETSNPKSGKIAFIKALGLLDEDARRFVRSLSELRNSLVHDISQVDFSISDHVETLDSQQFKSFVKSFGYFASGDEFEHGDSVKRTDDFLRKRPKTGVWYSVMALAAVIYSSKDLARLKRLTRSLQRDIKSYEQAYPDLAS